MNKKEVIKGIDLKFSNEKSKPNFSEKAESKEVIMGYENKGTNAKASIDFNEELEKEFLKIRKGEKFIKDISSDMPYANALITRLVKMNPNVFVELRADQRKELDAMIFVRDRLISTDAKDEIDKLYYETLNNEPAIKFNYLSGTDEIIEYFDPDLQLPTWLKVKASAAFKVINPLKLLKKINIQLTHFNMKSVYNSLKIKVTDIFRKEILTYINEKNMGYYHFNMTYAALTDFVRSNLNKACDDFGLEVIDIRIEKLIICDKIVDMIQNEYFNARSHSTRADAEIKWAEASLKILERKSEIIDKYKLPVDTLSEMEKDKAMERYLNKVNNVIENKDKLQKPTDDRRIEFDDALIQKRCNKPKEPEKPKHVSMARLMVFILLTLVGIVVGVFSKSAMMTIAFIIAAIFAVLIVITGIKKHRENLELKEYAKEKEAYDEKLAVYLSDIRKYKDNREKLIKSGKVFYETEEGLYLGKY